LPHTVRGASMAALAAALWGSVGVLGQVLMDSGSFDSTTLSIWRMGLSGILLLLFDAFLYGGSPFAIWKNKKDALLLAAFGCFGMMGTQYFYFLCIEKSSAPMGAILQYLMPAFVLAWVSFSERRLPSATASLAVVIAMAGTAILATGGSFDALVIAPSALFWGILSAIAESFYLIEPIGLMKRWRPSLIVGWGMILGSLTLLPLTSPARLFPSLSMSMIPAFLALVIFGTVIPFCLFLGSVQYVSPVASSILAALEPVTAVLLSLAVLPISFSVMEGLGTVLILFSSLLVTLHSGQK
jgi:drug/metabolite transporter (DMT)-like permease